jgi:hypothetical protein
MTNETYTIEAYGTGGLKVRPEAQDALCMRSGLKFYVKQVTTGPDAPHLYNPWSTFAVENAHNKLSVRKGKQFLAWKQVNQDVYLSYLKFLRTQSEVCYRQAERGLD